MSLRPAIWLSAISAGVTLLSLCNQLVIARTFGASHALDIYFQATSLPLLVMGIFVGIFSFSVVPVLTTKKLRGGQFPPYAGGFLLGFVLIGLAVGAVGLLFTPFFLSVFHIGTSSILFPEAKRIAWIGWATVIWAVLTGYLGALLTSLERFVLPVVAGTLPYIFSITLVVLIGARRGPEILAWGVFCGTLASSVVLLVYARDAINYPSGGEWLTDMRQFALTAPLVVLSVVSFSTFQTIDSYWAPKLGPGSVSYLAYCQRLLVAVGTVVAAGPLAMIQPRLLRSLTTGGRAFFLRDTGKAMRLVIVVSTPISLILGTLAFPTVQVAFQRGAFDHRAAIAVSSILPWMLAGMIPMVVVVLLFKALFALSDKRGALMLGVLGPVTYWSLSGVLLPNLGLRGIAIAYTITWTLLLVTATARLWGGAPPKVLSEATRAFVTRLLSALVAAGIALYIGREFVISPLEEVGLLSLAGRVVGVAALGAVSFGLFATKVWPIPEARELWGAFVKRR